MKKTIVAFSLIFLLTPSAFADGYSGRPGNGASGSVTSVGISTNAEITVSGSPITTTGTITLGKANQNSNLIYAGPSSGVPAAPSFRALVTNDMPAGTGTVTSVGLAVPSPEFGVTGSPLTTSGVLTITKANENANNVWAGPSSGGPSPPTFRTLVTSDLPAGTGTVTSVSMAGDNVIYNSSVTGSPITTTGTLTPVLKTQVANTILAGPVSGANATPSFRSLGLSDHKSVFLNQTRLYITSGQPYADTSSGTNIRLGPTNQGSIISFYDTGLGVWVPQTIGETTLALSGLSANTNYDVYAASSNSTTATLSTVVWTNDTTPPTRGTQDGHLIINGDATKLLVGSFRAVDATHTADTPGSRWVSNIYNAAPRNLFAQDPTGSWTYASTAWQAADANTADGQGRVSILQAVSTTPIDFHSFCRGSSLIALDNVRIGIAEDTTTTANLADISGLSAAANADVALSCHATLNPYTGYHYIQRVEASPAAVTNTYYGGVQGFGEGTCTN